VVHAYNDNLLDAEEIVSLGEWAHQAAPLQKQILSWLIFLHREVFEFFPDFIDGGLFIKDGFAGTVNI